jgi:hypothetical protein
LVHGNTTPACCSAHLCLARLTLASTRPAQIKYCYPGTVGMDDAAGYTERTDFIIRCEQPNPRLYSFEGAISRSSIQGGCTAVRSAAGMV